MNEILKWYKLKLFIEEWVGQKIVLNQMYTVCSLQERMKRERAIQQWKSYGMKYVRLLRGINFSLDYSLSWKYIFSFWQ